MDLLFWGIILGIAIVVIAFLIDMGFFELLFGLFSLIYEAVSPKRTSLKVIVAFISVTYGLFAIAVMGGPLGMLIPIFLDPFGFIFGLIIIFVVGILLFVVVSVVIQPFDSRGKFQYSQRISKGKTASIPKMKYFCSDCSKEILIPPVFHFTCRNCSAVFCKECFKRRGDLSRCPSCGKPVKSRTPDYVV